MKPKHLCILSGLMLVGAAQTASEAVIVNLDTAKWTHEKGAEPGSEGVALDTDKTTGGMDLLVRFPAGHVIPPHFHDSNERIFVAEGELRVRRESGDVALKTGGFAWLPAREVQRLSCSSAGHCTFYLSWDGKPDSHPAK
jgi:quercetin dioxygenase-like cupin family protein